MAVEKRQSIILGLAVLAVLYGLYDVLFLSRSTTGVKRTGETGVMNLQSFISQVATDIKSAQTDFGAYAASCAERPWVRNPFFTRSSLSSRARHSELSYTGYLETGGRGFAIINQVEYRVGEQLENRAGFFVKEITPARVIIENRPAKTELAVPLHD